MARINHVQLSPSKPDQQEDPTIVEDEIEAGKIGRLLCSLEYADGAAS